MWRHTANKQVFQQFLIKESLPKRLQKLTYCLNGLGFLIFGLEVSLKVIDNQSFDPGMC